MQPAACCKAAACWSRGRAPQRRRYMRGDGGTLRAEGGKLRAPGGPHGRGRGQHKGRAPRKGAPSLAVHPAGTQLPGGCIPQRPAPSQIACSTATLMTILLAPRPHPRSWAAGASSRSSCHTLTRCWRGPRGRLPPCRAGPSEAAAAARHAAAALAAAAGACSGGWIRQRWST
eukprot:335810-Chlamydomonas_euryale.AAC.2